MSATYFWYQDQIVVFERRITSEHFQHDFMLKYRYCYCVDGFEPDGHGMRYGVWVVDDETRNWDAIWQSRSPGTFPPEFRLALLIMGVTL